MPESLWIEQPCAGRPITVFIGEDAIEYQDLLALRMLVQMTASILFIADDRCDLT